VSAIDVARARWPSRQFRFLTAEDWGMTWKNPAVPEKLNDPEAYVHHSAGSRLGTDAVKAFQALNRFAQESKNYSALDYDMLVHMNVDNGLITVGEGRAEWMSAATKDRNELGEAVCLMGYFHPGHRLSEHPTSGEIQGLALAIAIGMERGWIARNAKILGHRDNPAHPGATGCPGDYLYPHMQSIRDIVEILLTPEAEEPMVEYILRTPPARVGQPWFYIHGGSVRYCTGRDVDYAKKNNVPIVDDTTERYDWLFKQVYGV